MHLIDTSDALFPELRSFLKKQVLRFAEKNINSLREYYAKVPSLVSNAEIIEAFVNHAMDLVLFDTDINNAKDCHIVFEAAVEDIPEKIKIFKKLKSICKPDTYFLTNTSSIPIHVLDEEAQLNHRIAGFHFYNPPHIQKLVEVILPKDSDQHLRALTQEIGKRLGKTLVFSKDVAGFIGNGHFLREISFACEKVNEIARTHPLTEAIFIVNKVTQEYLLRPMGIFQLLDYVGLDV